VRHHNITVIESVSARTLDLSLHISALQGGIPRMKTTTLELEQEERLMGEDPEAPPETTVEQDEHFRMRPVGHQQIAERAYQYWQERGCPEGSPEEDWYRAENELRPE
jgi:hypothetical protein